jgi:hypothetical protein
LVEMHWRARAEEKGDIWRGVNGENDSPGFICLKSIPQEPPALVGAHEEGAAMTQKEFAQFSGDTMSKFVKTCNLSNSWEWLKEAARTGTTPKDEDQPPLPPQDLSVWGPERIICGTPIRFIGKDYPHAEDTNEFWKLPGPVLANIEESKEQLAQINQDYERAPYIGYTAVPTTERPTYRLANPQAPITSSRARRQGAAPHIPTGWEEGSSASSMRWGADWSLCKQGHFAVVECSFENGRGIEVVKITNIPDVGDVGVEETKTSGSERGDSHDQSGICHLFQGIPLIPNKDQRTHNCIKGQWNASNRTAQPATYTQWAVVAYIAKLNNRGRSLPAATQRLLDNAKNSIFEVTESVADHSGSESEWAGSDHD